MPVTYPGAIISYQKTSQALQPVKPDREEGNTQNLSSINR